MARLSDRGIIQWKEISTESIIIITHTVEEGQNLSRTLLKQVQEDTTQLVAA